MDGKWTISELKETVLLLLALAWGSLLLAPGNVFTPSPRSDLGFLYALDWFWGILLIGVTIPMLPMKNRHKYKRFRIFAHIFYWLFWFGIFCLVIYRTVVDSASFLPLLHPQVWLIDLPFLTIALCHAVVYVSLCRRL